MRPSSDASKRSGSRYVLGDLLGRGGMAEVFAGYAVGDHGFQKPVAIKRLLPELANDEVFVERLIEEAKLLVGMQHGNIVSVLDLAREGDDVFLVMEFVDGPSLRQLIKARGARGLSLGVATYIVQSAAAGLEFAHARPGGAIIHADISPSNLLLTTSGEVRVADFGIARREGLGHGVVEGKWAYMAPEQARGEALTPRSDVFALGVVLYELLTGQHPFGRAVTANERDEQIQVIPPRVVKPSIPPGLDAICMRALAHAPRDRYGRMQQLIDALVEERFAHGLRDGASDLAQAIREVAPGSDGAAPRTMHTERPVTIMTRSLLRELTPPRRPSQTPAPPPAVAPVDPPVERFPAPTRAVTTPLLAEAGPQELPAIPSSGEQTVARIIDQVALAQAAQAAAAMLAVPSLSPGLRAEGAPMPPFRMSQADVRGDELASVVGGHTLSGHPGVAVEPRGHRWTIAVLGLGVLLGVGTAIAIQLAPSRPAEPAPERAPVARADGERRPSPMFQGLSEPDEREATGRAPSQPASADPAQPAADPGAGDGNDENAGEPAGAARPADPAPGDTGTAGIPASDVGVGAAGGAARDGRAEDGKAGEAGAGDAKAGDAKAGDAKAGDAKAGDARAGDARAGDARAGEVRTSDSRPGGRRPAAARDSSRRKPGILSVQSSPWSWVTVDIETKETPAKFYLAPGSHIVKLYNQENGLTKYEKVVIESDKLQRLDEDMDQ